MVGTTRTLLVVGLALGLGGVAVAQRGAERATRQEMQVWTSEQGEWMALPDVFPKGGSIKVMQGDPTRGAADFYLRFPAGYAVPWHFHKPDERVFVDRGTMRFETLGGDTHTLTEGGYILLPGRMVHRASCVGEEECTFYLASSGVFDIHVVDDTGKVLRSWTPQKAARR